MALQPSRITSTYADIRTHKAVVSYEIEFSLHVQCPRYFFAVHVCVWTLECVAHKYIMNGLEHKFHEHAHFRPYSIPRYCVALKRLTRLTVVKAAQTNARETLVSFSMHPINWRLSPAVCLCLQNQSAQVGTSYARIVRLMSTGYANTCVTTVQRVPFAATPFWKPHTHNPTHTMAQD